MALRILVVAFLALHLCHFQADGQGTTSFKEWYRNLILNPSIAVEPLLSVYLFNFTNPEEFLQGAKPILQQIGPYVYRQTIFRDDMQQENGGNELSFLPKQYYTFQPRLSKGNRQTDRIVTLNVPMLVGLSNMKNGPTVARKSIGSLIELLKEKIYVDLRVRDLIWGYKHPLLKLGNDTLPPGRRYPYDKFGLLVGLNDTDVGRLTVSEGLDGQHFFGEALKWNGKPEIGFWQPGSECNKVRGTDVVMVRPDLTKEDRPFVFNRNVCRAVPQVFQKEVKRPSGIEAYKFVTDPKAYQNAADNPENACFCSWDNSCKTQVSGVFDVSRCFNEAPILLSQPHFYQGDPSLTEAVGGMNPNTEEHESSSIVHPETGVLLGLKNRVQLNLLMETVPGVRQAEGLRDMIFPLVWFEHAFDGFSPEVTEMYKNFLQK